jgi:hypothetical protein
VNVVRKAIASLQLKNKPSASASIADEMTGFIMAEGTWTVPLLGGGICCSGWVFGEAAENKLAGGP